MIFLSRQTGDKSDLHQIIPISFNIREVLLESCQNNAKNMFMVQTRSQSKGVKAPMVKAMPNSTSKRVQDIKPIIIDDDQDTPSQTGTNCSTNRDAKLPIKHLTNQIYPQPAIMLPPRSPDPSEPIHKVKARIEPNLDFEENSPQQEGIITEKMYENPR